MIKFTKLTSTKKANKHFTHNDGQVSVKAGARIVNAEAEKLNVTNLNEFYSVISELTNKQCITLGILPDDKCSIVLSANEDLKAGKYGRNKHNVKYPNGDKLILLDIDEVRDGLEFKTAKQVFEHLCDIDLCFSMLELLIVPSSSCGVKFNGELLKGYSWHVYLVINETLTIEDLRTFVVNASFENGDGRVKYSKKGTATTTSLFDESVFDAERVIYAAKPSFNEGFEVVDGITHLYQSGITLNISDISTFDVEDIKADLINDKAVSVESERLKTLYIEEKTSQGIARGLTKELAHKAATKQSDDILTMDSVLDLDDKNKITVAEICKKPGLYDGKALPDPIEGYGYGATTAKFWWNEGTPKIHSFAHGEDKVYHIHDDEGDIVALFDDESESLKGELVEFDDGLGFEVIGEASPKNAKSSIVSVSKLKEEASEVQTTAQLEKLLSKAVKLELTEIQLKPISSIVAASFKKEGITPSEIKREYNRLIKANKAKNEDKDGSFVDDYIYILANAIYRNKHNGAEMGNRAFNTNYDRITPKDGEEYVSAEFYAKDRIKCVQDIMYVPKFGEYFEFNGVEYFNTYKPKDRKFVKPHTTDICERVVKHTAKLLPTVKDQEVLMSFIAHQVQKPGELLLWALVLQGVPGVGKSFYADMITEMLGTRNVGRVSSSMFTSEYNEFSTGKSVNCVDELRVDNGRDRYKVVNTIKPLITDTMLAVSEKYKSGRAALNTCNYFCTTNEKDAVPIDDNDRRWAVLFSCPSLVQLAKTDYFKRLFNDMRDNSDELFAFFNAYEIPTWIKNSVRAPETSAKKLMIEASKTVAQLSVEFALDEFENVWLDEGNAINITRLQEQAENQQGFENDFPKTSHLTKILMNMGYVTKVRRQIKGQRCTVYSNQ